MGEWMEKYNNAERQLDHYRMQATKISRIVPQKIRELEEQVEIAQQKLEVEEKNSRVIKQQMNDNLALHHEALDRHDVITAKLRAQNTQLREELTEKNNVILALEEEIEALRIQRKRDEDSVSQKVKLIKEHIHKSIRSLEIENIRLKRQVEQVENGKIAELNTEIERLKEINRVQACNRIAIFEEAYKKCCRDFNLGSPKMSNNNGNHSNSNLAQPFSPIYQHTSSVSSQDPLYTSISPDDNNVKSPQQRVTSPQHRVTSPQHHLTSPHVSSPQHVPASPGNHFNQILNQIPLSPLHRSHNESPPLPPRRTSASKCSTDERKKKTPTGANMCCPQSCCPSNSHYEVQYNSNSSTSSPPPMSLREAGDGSVSNDYDEIPCEGVSEMYGYSRMQSDPAPPSVRLRSNSKNDKSLRGGIVRNGSNTSPPSNFGSASTLPATPTAGTPLLAHNFQNNPRIHDSKMLTRDPLSPGCKREPSRSNPLLQSPSKHGKRSWETLIDSLALVGFTDALPNQKCVKSSIGKLPTYTVTEQVSFTDHPYELPPGEDEDSQLSPLTQPEAETEFERLLEKMKYMGESQVKQVLSSPTLSHSSKPLSNPLTNLSSPYHTSIAIRINKTLHEYAENPRDLYNASRTLLTLTSVELVNELYCQLLKQTHRQSREHLAYWHVLATVIPFITPKGRVMSYLKAHLERYSEQKTNAGRFAGYCIKVLKRCLGGFTFGKRQHHPCRLEIEATCGKPYLHSKPMSIPIHLPGGDYQVTGFDTVSSVAEVIRDVESQLGLRSCRWSGYTLFMDDPINPGVKVPINHSSKICDVIAKWEGNVKPNNNQIPQVIGLTYQKFLHLTAQHDCVSQVEYKLSALHLHTQAMQGVHGMEMELATCLGAVMAQAIEGNCPEFSPTKPNNDTVNQLSDFIEKYIPPNITDRCKDPNSKLRLVKDFAEIWSKFKDVSNQFLFQKYYSAVERWKYNKSTLFRGLYSHPKDGLKVAVCLNVTETRLTVINADTLVIMDAVDLDKITNFGGYPFSITLRINNKNISIMLVDKHKCYLLTELLASYCRLTHVVTRDNSV
ncbi:uncharacterized protein LOC134818504 isoform X2 [Bolinopsis microptera]|uniref:uncharacterized protein LOC134818504 isoform X2 n=1 Tax=Bolinopsis microptera TaxID=2820187 RepID=UPI003078C8EE